MYTNNTVPGQGCGRLCPLRPSGRVLVRDGLPGDGDWPVPGHLGPAVLPGPGLLPVHADQVGPAGRQQPHARLQQDDHLLQAHLLQPVLRAVAQPAGRLYLLVYYRLCL